VLPYAVAWSSADGVMMRYVLPVLWMTSYVPMMDTVAATPLRRHAQVLVLAASFLI